MTGICRVSGLTIWKYAWAYTQCFRSLVESPKIVYWIFHSLWNVFQVFDNKGYFHIFRNLNLYLKIRPCVTGGAVSKPCPHSYPQICEAVVSILALAIADFDAIVMAPAVPSALDHFSQRLC